MPSLAFGADAIGHLDFVGDFGGKETQAESTRACHMESSLAPLMRDPSAERLPWT
jgi:hypothetical protein